MRRPTVTLTPESFEVERVGVSLRAVTHDGDLLALDEREVGVLVVIDFHVFPLFEFWPLEPQTFRIRSPRPMPEAPVLTVSMIEVGSIAWMNASSFATVPVSSMV